MIGIGPMELGTLLLLAFGSGGLLGLPLSTPPLPPDPVVERSAPDTCLLHIALAGVAVPEAGSGNRTEQMLADPEMQEFLERVAAQLAGLGHQGAGGTAPEASAAVMTLARAAVTRPLSLSIERFRPPSPDGPPEAAASLVIRVGEQAAAVEQAVAVVERLHLAGLPPELAPRDVVVGGVTLQRIETPLGPLSWGMHDGTLVVAIGRDVLEPLLARMADAGRAPPAWKSALENRLPVERRGTLAYVDAAETLRLVTSLSAADRNRMRAVQAAAGLGGLTEIGMGSGMTAEGVAWSTWFGFDGPPRGIFASPASGIGTKPLARIPADAIAAQAWSLDLSATLATALEIAAAYGPQDAAAIRENLERFRAVVGLDVDTHLLRPLGPDWTVLSLPSPGGMLPSLAIIVGVRDRATFAKTHKALLGMLRNAAASGEMQLSVREVAYRGQTIFCLEARGQGLPLPVTPTWCLTNDALVVTISPQLMKTLLARDPAAGGIDRVRDVRAAVAGGDPSLVSVVDPVWVVGSLCGLYELAAPVARGMLRDQGLELDLPQLPPSSAIMPFVRPQVTTIRHEHDGIRLEVTGTVPLGPLTAGGGLLGGQNPTTPVFVGMLLPAVQSAREAARRAQAMNNFKQVMLAMLIHEDAKGRLPSQAICDGDGKPLLSWRVALLPFLEEGPLYEEFRLDEPWDSEHNLALVQRMPLVYADPNAPPEEVARGLTTVQVLTGPGTPFPKPAEGLRLGQISDGASRTVAIVEATPENAVPWTKPDDLEFAPERPLAGVGNPRRAAGLFGVGFFDGHVEMLPPDVSSDFFRASVTPAGGEAISPLDE